MDRRTKLLFLVIGSAVLLGAILWFVVWPLLKPVIPRIILQPPAYENTPPVVNIPSSGAGSENGTATMPGTFTYETYAANPDIATIRELKRRAGILAERAESGSSADGFSNYADAAFGGTPKLAAAFSASADAMRATHPKTGPLYLTIATRLVEIAENDMKISGNAFTVRVQLHVDVRNGDARSAEYREATIRFVLSGARWVPDAYAVAPYSP